MSTGVNDGFQCGQGVGRKFVMWPMREDDHGTLSPCAFSSSDDLALSVVDLARSAHLTFLDLSSNTIQPGFAHLAQEFSNITGPFSALIIKLRKDTAAGRSNPLSLFRVKHQKVDDLRKYVQYKYYYVYGLKASFISRRFIAEESKYNTGSVHYLSTH